MRSAMFDELKLFFEIAGHFLGAGLVFQRFYGPLFVDVYGLTPRDRVRRKMCAYKLVS
jgi:hypothetical protein